MKFFLVYLYGLLFSSATFAATDEMGYSQSNGTGLFLEPAVSYQMTSGNIDYGSGTGNSLADTRGFGAILRGGVHVFDRFFVAADARYALLKFSDNASSIHANAQAWDVAPTVGLQMADWGARFYTGYVLAGALDPKSANGSDLKFNKPSGWRIGAGLKAKHLSVNFEWQRLHFGDADFTRTSTTYRGVKHDAEGLVTSISFPMEFN